MADDFKYDVFLRHSVKDVGVVRDVAERLREDGLRVWFEEWEIAPNTTKVRRAEKIDEGLDHSRVLTLFMSANASGSEWAKLEADTFRFRDPLNKERRFIPLRLDNAPIKDSLAQFLYINWLSADREQEFAKLLEACRPSVERKPMRTKSASKQSAKKCIKLHYKPAYINAYAFSPDGIRALSASPDKTVRLWDLQTGLCLQVFEGHTREVWRVAWSPDQRHALSGSSDPNVRLWDVESGRCLRVLKGHTKSVWRMAFSADGLMALTGSSDRTIRVWDVKTGSCLGVLEGHTDAVQEVLWSRDKRLALSAAYDGTIRLWDVETRSSLRVLEGDSSEIWGLAWSDDERLAIAGGRDGSVRLWDIRTGRCLRVLEGHRSYVMTVALSADHRYALSGSHDKSVRLWDVQTGRCVSVLTGHAFEVMNVAWGADQCRVFSGDYRGNIRVWDLSELVTELRASSATASTFPLDQIQYTNAKVLLVGDTSAGKTGLAHRLATGKWKPSDGSTVGAWSTQWKLSDIARKRDVEREIWLWDFGGQADQRLIHQLYMDRTALILLLFNADQEDVLPGLRDWQTALRRCVPPHTPQFLVAGRIDTGFKASRGKLQGFAREQQLDYHETSSREGTGCEELRAAIMAGIPWTDMPVTTTEHLFKRIKDEILALRDEGQVLHTFKELKELLWQRLSDEPRFTEETLHTVIKLLDGPGAVKELDYGTYILLQPEWVNVYAQAVLRTLRGDDKELGSLPLSSIAEGKLTYQSVGPEGAIVEMQRLPPTHERIVLAEMERQLIERGLCVRQGDKLVFPSHCGRDRPAVVEHPSVFVSYSVKGYLDDIYATLVVRLADSGAFELHELWRDAADFDTLEGANRMGIKLSRESASSGEISVYFGPGVTQEEQVIFANYIHSHLSERSDEVQRLRYYVCPKCHTPKGNPQVLMEKLLAKKQQADTECDKCGNRFELWDALEKKFASKAVLDQVNDLQSGDIIRLDSRRKGKLLALEVGARITSADQKCFDIPGVEDEGLDLEVEFTDDDGRGTGKRLYLQLKAGNSYLQRRKRDGAEIFKIKKQSWVKYWLKQGCPVLLVIGTFPEEDEIRGGNKERFADIRWMEISELLGRESKGGTQPVKQIVFKGERLDTMSVRGWREKALRDG